MKFSIPGYPEHTFRCPICAIKERLSQITIPPELSLLRHIVESKLLSLNYRSFDRAEPDDIPFEGFNLTSESRKRVLLRCLYESSSYNTVDRRILNALLEKDSANVDLFLELVNKEFTSPSFDLKTLESRLFKSFHLLLDRITEFLRTSEHFQFESYAFAIEHIIPGSLQAQAPELFRRSLGHRTDCEELCIACIYHCIVPGSPERWEAIVNDKSLESSGQLVQELLTFLRRSADTAQQNVPDFLRNLSRLWAGCERSSPMIDPIVGLQDGALTPTPLEWTEIAEKCHVIWLQVTEKVKTYHDLLKRSPLWATIDNKKDIETQINNLYQLAAQIYSLAKAEYYANDLADAAARVKALAGQARQLISSIAEKIYCFVCDPTKMPPSSLQVTELGVCSRNGKNRTLRNYYAEMPIAKYI